MADSLVRSSRSLTFSAMGLFMGETGDGAASSMGRGERKERSRREREEAYIYARKMRTRAATVDDNSLGRTR